MAQSVCRLDVRVFFKQYRGSLLLPVGPFICGLEQQVTRAYEQFLAGVAIGKSVRIIFLALLSGPSISSLACCMASQRCLTRSSCTASQASFWIWKWSMTRLAFGNAVRAILRMESDKSSVTSLTALRRSSSIRCRTAITSSAFVPATTATKDCSRVCVSWLVTKVYNSPLESEDSSMQAADRHFPGTAATRPHVQTDPTA